MSEFERTKGPIEPKPNVGETFRVTATRRAIRAEVHLITVLISQLSP
jgi:hypothetical protein